MTTPLLFLRDAMVSFGGAPLFSGISFQLLAGDKICLVGRNGCGKSTLLKVVAGEVELDGGERYVKPGIKVGYLPQNVTFNSDHTVYEHVLENIRVEEGEHKESKKYLADQVLEHLRLSGIKPMHKLSGGKLRRAALARVLVAEPEVLLLDEPTNHLDLSTIEWLEEYVKSYPGGVLSISHDRAFLSATSDKTFWLDRGTLRVNNKGFDGFDQWSSEVMEQEIIEVQKLGKKLETENLWLQQGVTARRKRNQGRLKALFALREKLKNDQQHQQKASATAKLPPLSASQAGKMVIEMEHVSHAYHDVDPPKRTISNLSLRILRGERLAIMGRNGAGKTTFLKLLTGSLKPDSGTIRLGTNLDISYIDQKRESLNPDDTLWETLCPDGGDMVKVGKEYRHVIAYLKDFMFDSRQAKSPVSSLSGGEANRLLLAKTLTNPGNLLILDEPTNDLDMDTLDMLQDLLSDYEGTLILVSHDRDFVERIATRTLIFDGAGTVEDFVGGYRDYVKEKKQDEKKEKQTVKKVVKEGGSSNSGGKLSYKLQRELDLLPGIIDELTKEIAALEQVMADPQLYNKDPDLFNEVAEKLVETRQALADAEVRWLELEEMKEEKAG